MTPWIVIALLLVLIGAAVVWRQFKNPHALARVGNGKRIAALLDRSPGLLEARDAGGETPLFHAAKNDQVNLVATLLRRGANPNVQCDGGGTPLMLAARFGYPDVVRALVAAGAAVNVADERGVTALHYAASAGQAGTATALTELGADPALKDSAGHTPGQVALERGHAAVAKICEIAANKGGPANGTQPIRSETNRTSPAAGPRR